MAPVLGVVNFVESVTMRNAFGLLGACVVSAVVIAAVWYWTSSPRADAAVPPQTVNARKAEPLPAVAAKAPVAKPDVAVDAKPDSEAAPMRRDAGEPPRVKVVRLTEAPRAGPRILKVRAGDHFAAAGDDAAVLRGREAWLRSLDRKYGIAR